MKVLSHRRQVVADHSSTSYLFYSSTLLSKEVRSIVSELSSHVFVRAHTASIRYDGEFSDLGEARREKFLKHYDVEVRESYDWWDISIMLEEARLPSVELVTQNEETDGEANLTFERIADRLRLRFEGCHLDYSACYDKFGGGNLMKRLAEFAIDIRDELYAGKTDTLEVAATYCRENEILESRGLSPVAEILATVLEPI